MSKIGMALRQARKRKGLMQADVAELVAVAPATVSRWELEQSFGLTKKLLQAMLLIGLDPVDVFELTHVEELPSLD